jgi:hypothetical protein
LTWVPISRCRARKGGRTIPLLVDQHEGRDVKDCYFYAFDEEGTGLEGLEGEGEGMLLPPRRNPQGNRVTERHRRCSSRHALPPSLLPSFFDQEFDALDVERGGKRIGEREGDMRDFACCPGDTSAPPTPSFGEGVVDEGGGREGGGGGGREGGGGGGGFVEERDEVGGKAEGTEEVEGGEAVDVEGGARRKTTGQAHHLSDDRFLLLRRGSHVR